MAGRSLGCNLTGKMSHGRAFAPEFGLSLDQAKAGSSRKWRR